jgi:hypothetical protein
MATYLLLFALLLAGGAAYAFVSRGSSDSSDTLDTGGITRQDDESIGDDDHHKIRR